MFHWLPSMDKPRMTPVSVVNDTDSRFADWVTIWIVNLPERTKTARSYYGIGRDSAPIYSCNNWFSIITDGYAILAIFIYFNLGEILAELNNHLLIKLVHLSVAIS